MAASLTRRTIARGLASLAMIAGLDRLGLDDAEASKRRKKQRKGKKSGVKAQAASPETAVFPFHLDTVVPNPCTGENVHVVGDVKIVNHTLLDAKGRLHFRVMQNTQGVQGTGLTSGLSYRVIESDSTVFLEGSLPQLTTLITNLRFISQGGADNFAGHATTHVTINANGDLTADVAITSTECRG